MRQRLHELGRFGRGMTKMAGLPRREPIMAAVLVAGMLVAVQASAMTISSSASGRPAYLDSTPPVHARVNSLLAQMTLPEKIGQMVQIEVTQVTDTNNSCTSQGGFNVPNPVCEQKIFVDNHVGSILAGGTDNPTDTTGQGGVGNTGRDWANEYNRCRPLPSSTRACTSRSSSAWTPSTASGTRTRRRCSRSRSESARHGTPRSPETGGEITANALRATGWNWDFAPVQDLSRDNRWGRDLRDLGRTARSGGGAGGANVTRTADRRRRQLAQGHRHGEALRRILTVDQRARPGRGAGADPATCRTPSCRLMRAAIDAGAGTVMVNSGSINGIPATASQYLLTDDAARPARLQGRGDQRLRRRAGARERVPRAADLAGAAALAINAGVDMAMHALQRRPVAGGRAAGRRHRENLPGADQRGRQADSHAEIRARAVRPPDRRRRARPTRPSRPAGMPPCRRHASRSPCCATRTTRCRCHRTREVVVTGPSADSMTNQLGGWSVSWQGVFGAGHVCCMGPADQIPPGTTVLEGLQAADPNVVFAPDRPTAVAESRLGGRRCRGGRREGVRRRARGRPVAAS